MTTPQQHVERLKGLIQFLEVPRPDHAESIQWALNQITFGGTFIERIYLVSNHKAATSFERELIAAAKAIEDTQ